MENYTDESDNDLDMIADNENHFGDVSAEEDEAIEDNSHNHEETGGEGSAPPLPKPAKVKRPVLNPQPKLNFDTIQGPKGLLALNELFKNHKFRGNGYEKEDMADVLKKLEQWTYRLFPKFHFEDSLKRLETLGKKREVQVFLRKIRNGMLDNDFVHQVDDEEDWCDIASEPVDRPVRDSFDELLSQQITFSQTAATREGLMTPKPTLTPVVMAPSPTLTPEQLARIERNRKLAMERKLQKLSTQPSASSDFTPMELDVSEDIEVISAVIED